MSFNLKSLDFVKKAIISIVVLIILYPIVVWIYIGNCKGKYGIVDKNVIAEYQDQNNPNKIIQIKRFKSIIKYKYPFFDETKFEFFIIDSNNVSGILNFRINNEDYKYLKNGYSRTFEKIPSEIYLQLDDDSTWSKFRVTKKDIELVNNPNFKQKIIYGPTWNDLTMTCD